MVMTQKDKIEPIYDGLKFPTAIAFLGPKDMLVLEKNNNKIMWLRNSRRIA